MREISLECLIDRQPYTSQQLESIESARHTHVLHELKRLGAPVVHNGRNLADDEINLLGVNDARDISVAIRQRLGPDGVRALFKTQLDASDAMWKKANDVPAGSPMQVAVADLTIKGITYEDSHRAMSLDRLGEIYSLLNPDHYFAEHGEKGLVVTETFGMFGGPCELIIHPDSSIVVPVERLDDYPLLVAGFTTLREGTNPNMLAYHQYKPMESGFKVRMACILPPNTPKEIVDGHKVHMAIEIWNGAKLAAA